MSDAGKFISVVALHFPPPRKADDADYGAWLASMMRTLRQFDDAVLARAAQEIIEKRTAKDGKFFPLPSECTEICNRVAAQMHAEKTPLLTDAKTLMSYDSRVTLARNIMQAPIGRRAVKEGWGEAMFHFCVDHCRAPEGQEIERCKRRAQEFAADYKQCLTGDHPFGKPLAKLAEGMIHKARELMGDSRK